MQPHLFFFYGHHQNLFRFPMASDVVYWWIRMSSTANTDSSKGIVKSRERLHGKRNFEVSSTPSNCCRKSVLATVIRVQFCTQKVAEQT